MWLMATYYEGRKEKQKNKIMRIKIVQISNYHSDKYIILSFFIYTLYNVC